jgi:hypothetical protein
MTNITDYLNQITKTINASSHTKHDVIKCIKKTFDVVNNSLVKPTGIKVKSSINTILTLFFPFKELNARPSVFIQSTWLDKVMTSPQLKDYLWTPSISSK